MRWDPDQYARFSDHRSRPFFDLTDRVGARGPGLIVDLGCGSGELTVTLGQRWPNAVVRGIDSSPEMIAKAPEGDFAVGQAQDFDASGVDVLVSNAMLQWVPGHPELLQRWAGQLNAGGWLAFQVPGNFTAPSHVLMRELAESPEWISKLGGVLRHADAVLEPAGYLDLLIEQLDVDAWQTDYLHVLQGPDPVLEWVRGTGLRPVLAALDEPDQEAFTTSYKALLKQAYPEQAYGTVFGFRRTFVVGRKR